MNAHRQDTLSQDEIHARAVRFSKRWRDAKSEKSEAQTFINEFYGVFGLDRKSVAGFEEHPADTPDFIDCIQKGRFMIEMKSRGRNLYEAMDQAMDYYKELRQADLPKYVLACDFQKWYLVDKQDNSEYNFELDSLADNIGLFGFMVDRPKVVMDDPVNGEAVRMIGRIFDELKEADFGGTQASYFLTRIVFCLFADDTGIFPDRNMFQRTIKEKTLEDGSDMGRWLRYLFEDVLNRPEHDRSKNIAPEVNFFPYIDGDLFKGGHRIPDFNQNMRELLIEAGEYDWSKVSPAIFGTMFQAVMDPEARRETGSHYTTEENILKVVRPLFLDELNKEFDEIDRTDDGTRKDRFAEFHDRLASLKFLDPACGSGNFLVIAYRELRRLEHRVIVKIHGFDKKNLATEEISKINVNQFYGIEIGEFSAKIAEVSLWMMDHMMNMELNGMVDGLRYRRIPIKKKPNIACRDALEFDWNDVLPSSECSFVLGNPPFGGSKKTTREQRRQVQKMANITGGGTLDYVTGWFIKGGGYVRDGCIPMGFVSTNSITNGEQVGILWPILFDRHGLEIVFAHKPFKWGSEAPDEAQVTVVIIGLMGRNNIKKNRRLFHYEGGVITEINPKHISPYLVGSKKPPPIVRKARKPLNELPEMVMGSKPIDGGNYIFTDEERKKFLALEPDAREFIRPYVNADEFINGGMRSILALHGIEPDRLRGMPRVMERVKAVKSFRLKSSDGGTRKLAENPTTYHLNVMPARPFLLVPSTSSERRKYVPMGFVKPPIIPSNATMIVEDAGLGLFGLITSRMHMVWLGSVGGKLETRFRYSAGMVYNTFPTPEDWNSKSKTLEVHAQAVLDARGRHPDSKLADLYDPDAMPADLKGAHQKLDKEVEKLYRKKPFKSDDDRLEFLLDKYQKMASNQTGSGRNQTLSPK